MKISIAVTPNQALSAYITIFNQDKKNYAALQQHVKHLGVHRVGDATQFIFWTPEVKYLQLSKIELEIYRPKNDIDFEKNIQSIDFELFTLPMLIQNELTYGVFENIKMGNAQQTGDFYQLVGYQKDGTKQLLFDPLAYSIPFGAFSPAEVFDNQSITQHRKDENYLKNIKNRANYPANILEMHIPTTTQGGTIADLKNFYQNLSKNIAKATDFEKTFLGYDAIELMPLQALTEHEGKNGFWQEKSRNSNQIEVELQKPNTQNWGYDIVISASSAINPNLLKSKRPHELVELIETLHNFSEKPIQVILDVVYGHADGPAAKILNKKFIAGDGMYGKVLNYKQLMVRSILLESLRRMANYGVDGFRIDASQDINNWDNALQKIVYDDDFVRDLHKTTATLGEISYQPFMIFEDGRPWPERGWALKQTYREVTEMLPETVQWSPLTFADNNPHIFNFWQYKFFRIKEIAAYGERWLTGSSNHDSLRKGAQQNPYDAPINIFFGEQPNQIFHRGYNGPATKLLENFLPGIPMDFVQANVAAPWLFMRNTDEQWGLKVVSEEALFVNWFLDEEKYKKDFAFRRLKNTRFQQFIHLKNFINDLPSIVKITNYDWDEMLKVINVFAPDRYPIFSHKSELQQFANNFMEDAHDFCNVFYYQNQVESADYFLFLRKLKQRNLWLRKNLCQKSKIEQLYYYGATVYCIERAHPEDDSCWTFYGNMEGEEITIKIADYQSVIIQTPKAIVEKNRIILGNNQAVIVKR